LYIHQEIIMQVAKWGNSLGVRLPVALVQELGISEGDELEVRPAQRKTSKSKPAVEVSKEASVKDLLESMRKYRGRFPEGWNFDREEANAR
jgi:antitoxin MazE